MTGGHRTSSIQRPAAPAARRRAPRRRRRKATAAALPERALPGRPGVVQRAPERVGARPAAGSRTHHATSSTRSMRSPRPGSLTTARGDTAAGTPSAGATRRLRPVASPTGALDRTAGGTKRPSPLHDLSRPIARDSRMSERRPVRIGYGLIAGAIVAALIAALVVLPIRRWWNQRDEFADRQNELQILQEANGQLQQSVNALNTPTGIEEQARRDLNLSFPGEDRVGIVGSDQTPLALPAGYPYTLVNSILAARSAIAAEAASAAAAPTTVAPSAERITPAAIGADEPAVVVPVAEDTAASDTTLPADPATTVTTVADTAAVPVEPTQPPVGAPNP